jgi:outer membrane protein assembly factor BamA
MHKVVLLSFIFLRCISFVFSQDTSHTRTLKILPVPTIGYSPETRTYVGAVTLFTFNIHNDSATRTSNAEVEFNYTWNKQLILEAGWNYFSKHENWFTQGLIHYSKFPDLYYGIGPATPETNKVVFNSNRFVLETAVLKRTGKKIFSGLHVKYINYSAVSARTGNINYTELASSSTFGLGCTVLKDTRNNLLTPTSGMYVYGNCSYNISQSNYPQFTLDVRYYKTWNNKFTWANRLINDWSVGTPPFYDYAFLGGDKLVRGYYFGRYRDNHLCAWQTEFRLPVVGRLGLATLGGLSALYSAQNVLMFQHLRYNYGVGIRFKVDKKENTNLRLDYAIGHHPNSGFYVSFGESF